MHRLTWLFVLVENWSLACRFLERAHVSAFIRAVYAIVSLGKRYFCKVEWVKSKGPSLSISHARVVGLNVPTRHGEPLNTNYIHKPNR